MKRNVIRFVTATAMTSLFVFLILVLAREKERVPGLVATLHAQEGCSLATLEGEYLTTGEVEPRLDQRDDSSFPRRQIEVWTFDGAGNLARFGTFNVGGRVSRMTGTGTYTVDSDRCVAMVTYPWGAQWDLYITRDGREGAAMRVDEDAEGRAYIATRTIKKR